jgi:succinoglycan biosynthesis transport protein ExoP
MPNAIPNALPHALAPLRQPALPDPAHAQRPLTFYLRILRRQWMMIALACAAFTSLVVIVCAIVPPIHEGSAVIAIDRQAAPETIGSDRLLSTGDDQFMATQQNLIRGDTILRPVVERYHLLAREHQLRRYFFWQASPERQRSIKEAPIVLKHLKIERNPNTYLLTITYRDRDPRIAAQVANAIADSYLRDIFNTRIREAGRLTSSMEQQLIDLKLKMESTHNALMVYQRDLGTADPEHKTSVLVAKLQALNTENSAAVADRIAKEAMYRETQGGSLAAVQVSSQSLDLSRDVAALQAAKANLAAVAATYGDQHPEYQKAAAQLAEARAALEESRKNVASRIGVDYRQTLLRERMLSAAVAETKQEVDDLTAQSFDYLELKHEADTAERVYEDLFAKIKQSGINSELQNNIIRLANAARPAARPIFPNWPLIVSLSLGFSFLVCAAWVISAELTDASAKEVGVVQDAMGVPVICALPRVGNMQLRLALGADGMRLARSYLTLALALAMMSAEQGKHTLLIDADLRQPALERLLHLDPDAGLSEVLAQRSDWRAVTRPVVSRPHLFVLGAGLPLPRSLAQIGPQIRALLEQVTREYDLVVVDSPPLLGCAETLDLAAASQATVLAVRSGHTTMNTLATTVETLQRVNVPIAGIVLNESAVDGDATYKAYARYYSMLGSL